MVAVSSLSTIRSSRIGPTPASGLSPSRAILTSSGNARNHASARVRAIILSFSTDAFGPHVQAFSEGKPSAGQRLGEKRQALVHPVIDTGVVVGELLIAMRNAKLVQPPHEPTSAVEQVELILLAAVDVKCLQPAEIARLGEKPRPTRCRSGAARVCPRHTRQSSCRTRRGARYHHI